MAKKSDVNISWLPGAATQASEQTDESIFGSPTTAAAGFPIGVNGFSISIPIRNTSAKINNYSNEAKTIIGNKPLSETKEL